MTPTTRIVMERQVRDVAQQLEKLADQIKETPLPKLDVVAVNWYWAPKKPTIELGYTYEMSCWRRSNDSRPRVNSSGPRRDSCTQAQRLSPSLTPRGREEQSDSNRRPPPETKRPGARW